MSEIMQKEYGSEEDTLKGRYLTFVISSVTYGIEMFFIREIVGLQAITEMPEMPEYIKGIINLRGVIIPVMDMRLRFGKAHKEYDERTCVIVVEISGSSVGLIVDSVSEVLSIPEAEISEVPGTSPGHSGRFIKNIGKSVGGVVLIVDCGKLINEEEMEELSAIAL